MEEVEEHRNIINTGGQLNGRWMGFDEGTVCLAQWISHHIIVGNTVWGIILLSWKSKQQQPEAEE